MRPNRRRGRAAGRAKPIRVITRAAWGAWVVIAGLSAIVIVFGLAVWQFEEAADVATAVGAVSGVIAVLVGAYFGIRATLAYGQASTPEPGAPAARAAGGTPGDRPLAPPSETIPAA